MFFHVFIHACDNYCICVDRFPKSLLVHLEDKDKLLCLQARESCRLQFLSV